MLAEVKPWGQWLNGTKCPVQCWLRASANIWPSIRDYLLNTNVQLGATYATGKKSTGRYDEGYTAAAKYIGAERGEVGTCCP